MRDCYLRLTPRNGKYAPELLAARKRFEDDLLSLRARSTPARPDQLSVDRSLTPAAEERAEHAANQRSPRL